MDSNLLIKKLNCISGNIQKNHWKYFHKNSIENFILYLDKVPGANRKKEYYNLLDEYLNDVNNNFVANIEYRKYLFNSYIISLIPVYQNKLGFTIVPNKSTSIVIGSFAITIIVLLRKQNILLSIFIFFLVLLIFHALYKIRYHKAYGMGY